MTPMSFKYAAIEDAIVETVRKNADGRRVGVACSGGLDSGLISAIAKGCAENVTLYCAGTKNSHDVMMAEDLAKMLGLNFVHCRLTKGEMRANIRQMIEIAVTPDPFTVSYEMPLLCVLKEAEEDIILTGQGADEYFMGCAKFVDVSDEDYEVLTKASVRRLWDVSIPCETKLAEHFGKKLAYPYMDGSVIAEIEKLDPAELRPKDMDSRKDVLRKIASHLGYDFIASRPKKSSQYGSGTTDLIRGMAKENGMMYAEFIASVRDEVAYGGTPVKRGAVINARIDSVVKEKAERILQEQGYTPSQVIERVYRDIIDDGGFDMRE